MMIGKTLDQIYEFGQSQLFAQIETFDVKLTRLLA
jgi:hypothetical protein